MKMSKTYKLTKELALKQNLKAHIERACEARASLQNKFALKPVVLQFGTEYT
jgi:hypothetical protein